MNYIGKNCPYCQTPIKPGQDVVTCNKCKVVHHEDCWKENAGCTTFGCDCKVTGAQESLSSTLFTASTAQFGSGPETLEYLPPAIQQPVQKTTNNYIYLTLLIVGIVVGVIFTSMFFGNNHNQPTSTDRTKQTGNSTNKTSNTSNNNNDTNNSSNNKPVTPSREEIITSTVKGHYNSISLHNYREAYGYFSKGMQRSNNYDNWVNGFKNTIRDEVNFVNVISSTESNAIVRFRLTSYDIAERNRTLIQVWEGTWTLINENGSWVLNEPDIKKVDSRYQNGY